MAGVPDLKRSAEFNMRHVAFIALFLMPFLALAASPAEKPNTVLVHPGDVLYAKFEESGTSLKLLGVSKEKNDQAQLIFTMGVFDKKTGMLMLKVESRFKKNMTYKAEMRLLSKNRRQETSVVPVMAGLTSFETWPHPIEELALYSFELAP
jgi:hypothetical protein